MRSLIGGPLGAAVVLALVFVSAGCERPADSSRHMVPGLWQSDIDAMMRRLNERHAGLYRSVDRAELGSAVDRLVDSLGVYGDDRIILEISRVLAMIDEARTTIDPSSLDARFRRLPLELRSFGSELRVVAAAPQCREALGARLVAVGGVPVADVVAAVRPLVSRDNYVEYLVSVPRLACYGNVLSTLGFAPDPFSATLTLVPDGGDTLTMEVRTLQPDSVDISSWDALGPESLGSGRRASLGVMNTGTPDGGVSTVVTFGAAPKGGSVFEMLRSFFENYRPGTTSRIVFDLRGIDDPVELGLQAIPDAALRIDSREPNAVLVVLVDRETFASGLELALWLRGKLHAALVGESPRGRPNGARIAETFRLPNSGLRISYGAVMYEPAPRLKDSPYLPLDVYAAPTFDEYAAGNDPALEAALSYTRHPAPVTAADSLHAGMALIPAGEFVMGTPGGHYDPAHTVFIDSFYIDVHEVTNAQYAAYCEATGAQYPEFWKMDRYHCGPRYPDHPVVGVSLYEARKYAAWAGKKIPTEAEWEYAARGGLAGKTFPNGDELLPTDANYRVGPVYLGTVPVGCYAPNGYDLYDMAGNVVEWVNDMFEPFWYAKSPYRNPTGPQKGFIAVIRGGGWHSGRMCCDVYNRNALKYSWVDIAVGFRCAADMRPARNASN
jgi:formylglycine-generating enzyme required for sulfatase activity